MEPVTRYKKSYHTKPPKHSIVSLSSSSNLTHHFPHLRLDLTVRKMACTATSAAAFVSNARVLSPKSVPVAKPVAQSLTVPTSFTGLRRSLQSRVSRSVSLSRGSHSRKSFVVKASVSAFRCSSLIFLLCPFCFHLASY